MDPIEQLSSDLANRITEAAAFTVGVHAGRRPTSGIVWRPDVVVASAQTLPGDAAQLEVMHAGKSVPATVAGRDPSTNIAVLKLETPIEAALPVDAAALHVGNLALLVGADPSGNPTGRLAMVHALGDGWHSMAGGRIDAMIRLDCRLDADEGGPVLTPGGGLIGMSTSGPRRRTIVIPTATLRRVIDPLLAQGQIARGWLGVGLQPVMIPDSIRQTAVRESGLMIVGMASGGPAETAGMLPGDIVLDVDGTPITRPRDLVAYLAPDRIGQSVSLGILRAGVLHTLAVTIAARPPT